MVQMERINWVGRRDELYFVSVTNLLAWNERQKGWYVYPANLSLQQFGDTYFPAMTLQVVCATQAGHPELPFVSCLQPVKRFPPQKDRL